MRSNELEAAITAFLRDAAGYLQDAIDCGSEIAFEVERRGASRGRTPLYCYLPLTSEFIEERWPELSRLPSFASAVAGLEHYERLGRYLSSCTGGGARSDGGRRRSPAQVALRMLVEEVFGEQSDFELRPERLQRALAHLDRAPSPGDGETTVVATLHGMTLVSSELPLTGGLRIAQPRSLTSLPEEVMPIGPTAESEHLLVVLTREHGDGDVAIVEARAALRDLLCALRLFGDARVSLGGLAWIRVDGGRWRPVAVTEAGRPHGMLVLAEREEDELRAFCKLISRRSPQDGELSWALRRYQLGSERGGEHEALSDYLLALRALLEPDGAPRGALAGRLAALCAMPDQRAHLTEVVARAIELERAVISGRARERASSEDLVRAIADNLRALLRDVICGHLDADLGSLADGLLAATESPDSRVQRVVAVAAHDETAAASETRDADQDCSAEDLDEQRLRLIAMPG